MRSDASCMEDYTYSHNALEETLSGISQTLPRPASQQGRPTRAEAIIPIHKLVSLAPLQHQALHGTTRRRSGLGSPAVKRSESATGLGMQVCKITPKPPPSNLSSSSPALISSE